MKTTWLSALLIMGMVSLSYATKPKPSQAKLSTAITVIPKGSLTAFRFTVHNGGTKEAVVHGPFANTTRLLIQFPDGRQKEISVWKENAGATPLQPGRSVHWDLDVAQWVKMKTAGHYRVSFSVNGIESNRVILVQD